MNAGLQTDLALATGISFTQTCRVEERFGLTTAVHNLRLGPFPVEVHFNECLGKEKRALNSVT
jgi:hypothetical protein